MKVESMALTRREFAAWAIAGALLGVGCKPAGPSTTLPTAELGPALRRVRRRVRKHVGDRSRRKRVLSMINAAAELLGGIALVLVEWRETMALLPDEQRRERGRILAITREHNRRIAALVHEAAVLAVAMREQLTAQEWGLVFPSPTGASC